MNEPNPPCGPMDCVGGAREKTQPEDGDGGGGVAATPSGTLPAARVAAAVLLMVSITETLPSPPKKSEFATYASNPSAVKAISSGSIPTGTVVAIELVLVSIIEL